MTSYGIGDVEALLGLKAHVIRYWEREIPLIRPQKDASGRRLYSKRDLRLLLRLKYLLYERHFTIEGAREELIREMTGHAPDLRAHIDALRSDLVELYFGPRRASLEANGAAAGRAASPPPSERTPPREDSPAPGVPE
ncbi:MAG: MerR family transcriptional regulator [Spirochaetaceae bacterium]|jgi:DNA-binding transcriptional MerR regulator|nr:MerR family transcriptional regulator [Spirochaetaceae bacterium]